MLVRVLGIYINPDVVGWVTHEQKFNEVTTTPGPIRRDTIEIFNKEGVKILSHVLTTANFAAAKASNEIIKDALYALGLNQNTKNDAEEPKKDDSI